MDALRRLEIWQLAAVDAVGRHDDLALRRLAEDLGQPDDGERAAFDAVMQHGTRADGRQLIHVTDKHELRARADRGEQ